MIVYHIGHKIRRIKKNKKITKNRSCNGKKKYFSEKEAIRDIMAMKHKKLISSYYSVYPCKWCSD